jgi:hypothetical protein
MARVPFHDHFRGSHSPMYLFSAVCYTASHAKKNTIIPTNRIRHDKKHIPRRCNRCFGAKRGIFLRTESPIPIKPIRRRALYPQNAAANQSPAYTKKGASRNPFRTARRIHRHAIRWNSPVNSRSHHASGSSPPRPCIPSSVSNSLSKFTRISPPYAYTRHDTRG